MRSQKFDFSLFEASRPQRCVGFAGDLYSGRTFKIRQPKGPAAGELSRYFRFMYHYLMFQVFSWVHFVKDIGGLATRRLWHIAALRLEPEAIEGLDVGNQSAANRVCSRTTARD